MIFPRKKLILPCHKNGYLQSAFDARKYRDRFKRNPLAKVADMFVPKPLRMSPGYPCCCRQSCVACDTTITADDTVTWFEHEVNEETGEITRIDKSGDCVTYYVDSVSGGGAESGTGTEEDPWTNLNTVFSNSCIYAICTTEGCPKVKVLVKGTIDYIVSGIGYNYDLNLIIEPWTVDRILIQIAASFSSYAALTGIGTNFKHLDVIAAVNATSINAYRYGMACNYSNLDDCTAKITATTLSAPSIALGIACSNGACDNCRGESMLYSSVGMGGSSSGIAGASSTFNNCTGIGNAERLSISAGFQEGVLSSYYKCVGTAEDTGTGTYAGYAYGFNSCYNSTFNECSGDGSGYNGGIGFYNSYLSSFLNCDGYGYSSGNYCCGFYGNASSSFLDCTDTNDCSTPTCDSIS